MKLHQGCWVLVGVLVSLSILQSQEPPPAISDQIRVVIQLLGYRPCWCEITLKTPGELNRDPGAQDIELVPEEAHEFGTLVVHAPPVDGVFFPRTRYLVVRTPNYHATIQGRPLSDEKWEFSGVPALGEMECRINTTVVNSEPLTVVLRAGERIEAAAVFPAPTGVAVEVRDRGGERLFNADGLYFLQPGSRKAKGGSFHSLTRMPVDQDSDSLRVGRLSPGRHEYVVQKQGFKPVTGSLDIEKGQITKLVIVLEEAE